MSTLDWAQKDPASSSSQDETSLSHKETVGASGMSNESTLALDHRDPATPSASGPPLFQPQRSC